MPASSETTVGKPIDKTSKNASDSMAKKTKAQLKAERKAAFEAQLGTPTVQKEENTATKQKSKAQLKAERRALQEAQRAAKAVGGQPAKNDDAKKKPTDTSAGNQQRPNADIVPKTQTTVSKDKLDNDVSNSINEQVKHSSSAKKIQELKNKDLIETGERKISLLSHLPLHYSDDSILKDLGLSGNNIHPAVIRLGLQTRQGTVSGSNGRCIALLAAFKEVIQDYVTPPQKELSRDLEAKLKSYMNFLGKCRPLSVSMANAAKFLSWQITHIPAGTSDVKAKEQLSKAIYDFIHMEIVLAQEAISHYANEKISNGDVIMTFACSSSVKKVLCDAYKSGKKFRVIVVDSRPQLEGKAMAQHLAKEKIPCHYILINAISSAMREVTSVILGAHALQANGYVMARIGSSQIALVARAYNVPVLVCCETYKFCERVHTDSFVHNELGNPNDLVNTPSVKHHLSEWQSTQCLHVVNLLYDLTPPDFVSMVITEKDKLPCTSVPVVLRVKHAGIQDS